MSPLRFRAVLALGWFGVVLCMVGIVCSITFILNGSIGVGIICLVLAASGFGLTHLALWITGKDIARLDVLIAREKER